MTTIMWPTRFAVLLVVAMLAFTNAACGGGNPGGPDPLPSPTPTPAGTWVRMTNVNPPSGSVVRLDTEVSVSVQYRVEGHTGEQVMIRASLSTDGVTTIGNGGGAGTMASSTGSGAATLRMGLSRQEAERLGINRTNFIVVRAVVRATDEILTQEVYEVSYNYQ